MYVDAPLLHLLDVGPLVRGMALQAPGKISYFLELQTGGVRVMYMLNLIQRERPVSQVHMAGTCTHPLAVDRLEGRFGGHVRRMFCLVCEHGWWESNGRAIGSTAALGLISMVAKSPRPMGWLANEAEWQRMEDNGLVPAGARG
jgi:hypothetical protein